MSTQGINYKMAKALKEAGFKYKAPETYQEAYTSGGKLAYMDCDKGGVFWLDNDVLDEEDLIFIPTLSELIDACGKRFAKLTRLIPPNPRKARRQLWLAYGFELEPIDNTAPKPMISEMGKTPEEAVAKLWLKLNKNHYINKKI